MIKESFSKKTFGVKTWKEVEELVLISEGKSAQDKETASAEAFKLKQTWCIRGTARKSAWLEQRTRRAGGEEFWEITKGQLMKGLGNHKDCSFYWGWRKGFKERNSMDSLSFKQAFSLEHIKDGTWMGRTVRNLLPQFRQEVTVIWRQ